MVFPKSVEVLLISVTPLSGLVFYSRSLLIKGEWGVRVSKNHQGRQQRRGDLYVSLSHITVRFRKSRTRVRRLTLMEIGKR